MLSWKSSRRLVIAAMSMAVLQWAPGCRSDEATSEEKLEGKSSPSGGLRLAGSQCSITLANFHCKSLADPPAAPPAAGEIQAVPIDQSGYPTGDVDYIVGGVSSVGSLGDEMDPEGSGYIGVGVTDVLDQWPQPSSQASGVYSPAEIPYAFYYGKVPATLTDRLYGVKSPSPALRDNFNRAVAVWNSQVGQIYVRWRPKTPQDRKYVLVGAAVTRDFSFAQVGRSGAAAGARFLSLEEGTTMGVLLHEMMHSAGFSHEHQRRDRNAFVYIVHENIRLRERAEFDLQSESFLGHFGAYNYESIMHYSADIFCVRRKNGVCFGPTMLRIPAEEPGRTTFNRRMDDLAVLGSGLTPQDIQQYALPAARTNVQELPGSDVASIRMMYPNRPRLSLLVSGNFVDNLSFTAAQSECSKIRREVVDFADLSDNIITIRDRILSVPLGSSVCVWSSDVRTINGVSYVRGYTLSKSSDGRASSTLVLMTNETSNRCVTFCKRSN